MSSKNKKRENIKKKIEHGFDKIHIIILFHLVFLY